MSTADNLGDRMKQYEETTRFQLLRRTPTIIRLDGRAFHTFTKCLKHYDSSMSETPFSSKMHNVMIMTMLGVMAEVQNAVFGYTQSDEISILLRDWDKHETEQWFNGGIQKICSVSASAASVIFNHFFSEDVRKPESYKDLAQFDARVFNIPEAEVVNSYIWRQQDASRNSVQMLGRFHFSQKMMHGKNNSQVQDMLMLEKGINWNDIPTWQKRGTCAYRNPLPGTEGSAPFVVDEHIPIFTTDRDYVGRHLLVQQEVKES